MHYLATEIPPADLRVQLKPSKGVFAAADIKAGEMVILPLTDRLTAMEEGAQPPVGALQCGVPATISPKSFFLVPRFDSSWISPAFAIRSTEDAEEANVEVRPRLVLVTVGPQTGKKKQATTIGFPTIVSNVDMSVGTELLIHRPRAEKKGGQKRPALGSLLASKTQRVG